jgi:hypothetical protein
MRCTTLKLVNYVREVLKGKKYVNKHMILQHKKLTQSIQYVT